MWAPKVPHVPQWNVGTASGLVHPMVPNLLFYLGRLGRVPREKDLVTFRSAVECLNHLCTHTHIHVSSAVWSRECPYVSVTLLQCPSDRLDGARACHSDVCRAGVCEGDRYSMACHSGV